MGIGASAMLLQQSLLRLKATSVSQGACSFATSQTFIAGLTKTWNDRVLVPGFKNPTQFETGYRSKLICKCLTYRCLCLLNLLLSTALSSTSRKGENPKPNGACLTSENGVAVCITAQFGVKIIRGATCG